MRRALIFVSLIIVLVAMFRLSQLAQDWHYIVPPRPGEVLYTATFDGDLDDWEQYEGRNSAQIQNGVMRLFVGLPQDGSYSAASPYFSDFDARLEMRAVEGPEDNGYGVIFRQKDRGTYFIFLISSDGYYRVKRLVNNNSRIISNWNASPLINLGIGATNHLRVVGRGDRFQFYINGQRVQLCIPDNPEGESTPLPNGECRGGRWSDTLVDDSIRYGRIGVTVEVDLAQEPNVLVEFDNVIILGPLPVGD